MDKKGYKIIKQLRKGNFGEVYLAQKEYALKRIPILYLNKEEIDNYNNIFNIISKIDNEYIIKYIESYIDNNYLNIIMEYGGDTDLKKFIKKYKDKNKLISEKIIKDIIKQICLGLKEIHKKHLIHRDLTPDNIFINYNDKIKIGAVGISKILNINNKYTIGKHHYIAPEIDKGEKYNNKVDIYSLGCIIYELFTLKEYYIDKKCDNKDGKININIYNKKWQNLIDLLLKNNYNDRPNIEEILEYINNITKNEGSSLKKENIKISETKKNIFRVEKDPAVGIDLGTSFSRIGIWQNGKVYIVPNDVGERKTSSFVSFTDKQRLIGDAAKFQITRNQKNTVFDIKRLIGRKFEDREVKDDIKSWPFKVIKIQKETDL